MLLRVEKNEVQVGMFIEAVEGAWADNPLQQRRFFLKDREQVRLLSGSNISGVFINTALGRGVESPRIPKTSSAQDSKDAIAAERTILACTEQLQSLFGFTKTVPAPATLEPVVEHLAQSMQRNHRLFIDMTRLKAKDTSTFLHSIAVSALMIHFGRYLELGEDVIKALGIAGILHDVGKLAIPNRLLTKIGPLTTEERALIETHTVLGWELLQKHSEMSPIVLDVCRHHHERVDGCGYPDRLSLPQLSVNARIGAICDVYDAVTTIRPYKQPWSSNVAMTWMLERSGHFDLQLLVKFFLSIA